MDLLTTLPGEVIRAVILRLDDPRDLLRLSQTSRSLALPALWREVLEDVWGAASLAELAASCARTFYARTRSVPTAVDPAPAFPEAFVPSPLSEYRLIVEITRDDSMVLAQVVEPFAGMSSQDYDVLRPNFAAEGGLVSTGPAPFRPSSRPSRATGSHTPQCAGAAGCRGCSEWDGWERSEFGSGGWSARLCVVHAGHVVCLGVCDEPNLDVEDDDRLRLWFSWKLATRTLPDVVIAEIEDGLSTELDSGIWLNNLDVDVGRGVALTKGMRAELYAYLEPRTEALDSWAMRGFGLVAEPLLTFPGCDEEGFHYNNWGEGYHVTDEMLAAFLHAAVNSA